MIDVSSSVSGTPDPDSKTIRSSFSIKKFHVVCFQNGTASVPPQCFLVTTKVSSSVIDEILNSPDRACHLAKQVNDTNGNRIEKL